MGNRYKGNAGVGGTDAARARRVRTRRARGPASAARHGDARDEKTERGGNTALGVTQRTDDFAFTACNQAASEVVTYILSAKPRLSLDREVELLPRGAWAPGPHSGRGRGRLSVSSQCAPKHPLRASEPLPASSSGRNHPTRKLPPKLCAGPPDNHGDEPQPEHVDPVNVRVAGTERPPLGRLVRLRQQHAGAPGQALRLTGSLCHRWVRARLAGTRHVRTAVQRRPPGGRAQGLGPQLRLQHQRALHGEPRPRRSERAARELLGEFLRPSDEQLCCLAA
jgi:hypothetical protein